MTAKGFRVLGLGGFGLQGTGFAVYTSWDSYIVYAPARNSLKVGTTICVHYMTI